MTVVQSPAINVEHFIKLARICVLWGKGVVHTEDWNASITSPLSQVDLKYKQVSE